MINYTTSIENICVEQLVGFFEGWPKPPSLETHLEILRGSSHLVLAINGETNQVVGFVNAISDNVLSAYIPLLEVLPEYRKQGIARELIRKLLEQIGDLYMIDLTCDKELELFYEKFGFKGMLNMAIRNFPNQSGRKMVKEQNSN